MPSSSRHGRSSSPPLSTSSQAFTIGQQHKLNIVTRLAIEGKAKKGEDGVALKMYLKISLPSETISTGSTIPLFPEDNIKIVTSQVHPLDNNSAPYNFSSTTCPLLHSAARALNLPARSSQSYLSLFGLSTTTSTISASRQQSSSSSITPPPLDNKYTGHIVVSGYNVCYVLPKELPSRFRSGGSATETEVEGFSRQTPSSIRGRRSSIADKNSVQFMIAISVWIPFVARPPRAPFLLSIPTPRCLSNTIKLRIFPLTTTSASFASLSSVEDDGGTWDLTSDPHVTRGASNRLTRTNSYTHFADDESSDSSTAGFSEGPGIQGTFPTSDHIRVRWAAPTKTVNLPERGDGRGRVGVREVIGEMTCAILGKGKSKAGSAEGILMNVEYKGSCKGIWFPGVATLLGMDVGLEAKGSDVTWANGFEAGWKVSGGTGYTGFDVGTPSPAISRESSIEGVQMHHPTSSPITSRQNSTSSSTSSLLRAPLPVPNTLEYSFEGSATSSAMTSSISSLTPASTPNVGGRSRAVSVNGRGPSVRPPGGPITVHINVNDLLLPSSNLFTFRISGTILVTPRAKSHGGNLVSSTHPDSERSSEPVVLPRFTVLAADAEKTSIIVRNEVDNSTLEVFNPSGDIRDAQTRKTVVQRGGFTKCGSDGGRVLLRTFRPAARWQDDPGELSVRPTAPNGISRASSTSSLRQVYASSSKPKRDGPLLIPSVVTTVTPLLRERRPLPEAYAVRAAVDLPADEGTEWLEFGLAQPDASSSKAGLPEHGSAIHPPHVQIISASIGAVPVRFEIVALEKEAQTGLAGLNMPIEQLSENAWVCWVRVHVGTGATGRLLVDYVVKRDDRADDGNPRGKGTIRGQLQLDVLLPTFSLPVGRLEVNVQTNTGLAIASLRSNLAHQHHQLNGHKLLHFSLEELFHPRLSLAVFPVPQAYATSSDRRLLSRLLHFVARSFPAGLLLVLVLCCYFSLGSELRQMRRSLETCTADINSVWESPVATITLTTTVLTSAESKRWFGETVTEAVPQPTLSTLTDNLPPGSVGPTNTATTPIPISTSTEPTPPAVAEDMYSLMPIYKFPFPWPLRFDLPPFQLDLPPLARETMDQLLQGLAIVWQGFRKVYHYPLDPP